jgi:hypothetical protein
MDRFNYFDPARKTNFVENFLDSQASKHPSVLSLGLYKNSTLDFSALASFGKANTFASLIGSNHIEAKSAQKLSTKLYGPTSDEEDDILDDIMGRKPKAKVALNSNVSPIVEAKIDSKLNFELSMADIDDYPEDDEIPEEEKATLINAFDTVELNTLREIISEGVSVITNDVVELKKEVPEIVLKSADSASILLLDEHDAQFEDAIQQTSSKTLINVFFALVEKPSDHPLGKVFDQQNKIGKILALKEQWIKSLDQCTSLNDVTPVSRLELLKNVHKDYREKKRVRMIHRYLVLNLSKKKKSKQKYNKPKLDTRLLPVSEKYLEMSKNGDLIDLFLEWIIAHHV